MNNLIKFVESDKVNLGHMMNEFIYAYHHLSNNKSKESRYLANRLFNRFSKDCPLDLPAFAYLLTKEGITYVFKAPEKEKQAYIDYAIERLKNYIINRKLPNIDEMLFLFIRYLEKHSIEWFSDSKTPYEQWKEIQNDFGMIAREVLSIPCFEAAVEKLYSYLTEIISSSMYNSSIESIEARLRVHLYSI